MIITKASESDLHTVVSITHDTIKETYPRYYPLGIVDFFVAHHSKYNIQKDIENGNVYLFSENNIFIGTATIENDNICRVYVHPTYQRHGHGTKIMDFCETEVSKRYSSAILDSSLPAYEMYCNRGYRPVEYHSVITKCGDVLCYHIMRKDLTKESGSAICYDKKRFTSITNTSNGEVSDQTQFFYRQSGNTVWAEYYGGEIEKGFLIGHTTENSRLHFYYTHINVHGELRCGTCNSTPEIMPDGRIKLYEQWQWLNGDCSSGQSVIIQITV